MTATGPQDGGKDDVVFPHHLAHHSHLCTGGIREAWAEDAARTLDTKTTQAVPADTRIISPPKSIKVTPAVDHINALPSAVVTRKPPALKNVPTSEMDFISKENSQNDATPIRNTSTPDNNSASVADDEFEIVQAALVGPTAATTSTSSKKKLSSDPVHSLSYDTLLSERERLLAQLEVP